MQIGKYNILFGSDPECFIQEVKTNKIVSSIPLIPETKEKKFDLENGFSYYHDNVTVEGTIAPADSVDGFINNLNFLFGKIQQRIGDNYRLVMVASNNFTPDQLKDKDALEIGCSPFFLSHSVEMAEPPTLPDGYRSAGFHLHFGREDFKNPSDDFLIDPYSKINFINLMDVFVGIPSVLFDNSKESQNRKRIYTQTAGSHRPCDYGVEYRPLSANCLRSEKLIKFIMEGSILAIEATINEQEISEDDDAMIVDTINNHNFKQAEKLAKKLLPADYYAKLQEFIIHE